MHSEIINDPSNLSHTPELRKDTGTMFKLLKTCLTAAAVIIPATMATMSSASAATIKLVVVQEDWDKTSLARNTRVQNAIMNVLNQTLHAPAYQGVMSRYGISGMDVYSETALTLNVYGQDRIRRRDEELISLARTISNPSMDVMVLYTVYARAVADPYTNISRLQMALNYRALDVKSSRFLGGGNLDINTAGVPITGCATGINGVGPDQHCVLEFVSRNAENLARDAGNKLALQLSSMLGRAYATAPVSPGYTPTPPIGAEGGAKDFARRRPPAARPNLYGNGARHKGCNSLPTTFMITFRGFSQRQINFVEGNMANWKCSMDLDLSNHNGGTSFSQATYEYKTTANQQRIIRNIRLMLELIGIVAETRTNGVNEIIVSSLALREN